MGRFGDFFRMGPYRADHFPALRAAVGIAVPLLVLLILDRPDLSLYAVFGAFSGVYGRMSGYRERLFQQSQAALIMLATVFVALWLGRLAPGPWTLVLLTALAAAAATVLATLLRFGPVGGFFAIFAFAAISHSPPSATIWQPLLANAGASLLAVLLGLCGLLFRPGDRPWQTAAAVRPIDGRHLGMQALRYLLAVALAGAVSTLLGLGHSYWAMVSAAVVMMGADRWGRMVRGVHRVVGTFGGLLIFWALSQFQMQPWQVLLLLVALQFMAEFLIVRQYGLAMLFITPLALTMMNLVPGATPGSLITDRALETLLGVLAGLLVAWSIHEPTLRRLKNQVQRG